MNAEFENNQRPGFDEPRYEERLERIFVRFPSVQKAGFGDAYKPGLAGMEAFNAVLGHPDREFRSIHVAGTNGKGSVANMLASALAATGLRTGLYTSPHILDFRERMRILDPSEGDRAEMISKEEVWDFLEKYEKYFDGLQLSFFEITTGMAFRWFAERKVDVAVIETGLGGRLDSTNIITPELSVITSIGLDHCALLGHTRAAIAGEKAGIFKAGVPALVASRDGETAPVFEARAAGLPCPLIFADQPGSGKDGLSPAEEFFPAPADHDNQGGISGNEAVQEPEELLARMDLQGAYQKDNLRTVFAALRILGLNPEKPEIQDAIASTAARMDFHGRWETVHRHPDIICDIGHNPPALKKNFAQLEDCLKTGQYRSLIIVYGVMADKDLGSIIPLMPLNARYITVAPHTARAMDHCTLFNTCKEGLCSRGLPTGSIIDGGSVADGLSKALEITTEDPEGTLIYIGGSTFVVSEAVSVLGAAVTT